MEIHPANMFPTFVSYQLGIISSPAPQRVSLIAVPYRVRIFPGLNTYVFLSLGLQLIARFTICLCSLIRYVVSSVEFYHSYCTVHKSILISAVVTPSLRLQLLLLLRTTLWVPVLAEHFVFYHCSL